MKNGIEIIDFLCHPPLNAYRPLFDLHCPSMRKVGEDAALDLLMREIDESGIDLVVAPGREAPRTRAGTDIASNVSDEALVRLRGRFNNRLLGLAGLDLSRPAAELADQIEVAVKEHDLRGVVIEPGCYSAPDGGPLRADDKSFYSIYETIMALDVFVMYQGAIQGVGQVLQDLPQLKLVLGHGGYPAVVEALGLATKYENCYLSPDVHCFFPGGELYVNAIEKLQDQVIFASAYPMAGQKQSVDQALQFPVGRDVLQKFMYDNAARLLRI